MRPRGSAAGAYQCLVRGLVYSSYRARGAGLGISQGKLYVLLARGERGAVSAGMAGSSDRDPAAGHGVGLNGV